MNDDVIKIPTVATVKVSVINSTEGSKMNRYFPKSKLCKNCGEWVSENRDFVLENKIKELQEYIKKSDGIDKETKEYLLRYILEV